MVVLLFLGIAGFLAFGQFRGDFLRFDRGEVPLWENPKRFESDVFTFIRIKYSAGGRLRRWGNGGPGTWWIDYPDGELNLSFRLQQLTSIKVNPLHPNLSDYAIELTDPRLPNYPFIYIVEPGDLMFSEEEVEALRRYLFGGGFLLVDDFWGEDEWDNFYREIKRVFPNREPQELPIEHPIFNCVFPVREKPQIPNVRLGTMSQYHGRTWEQWDAKEPHFRAIYDDKQRIMVMICHNTDLGDGWEREGENEYYFREFSEKKAFPLGINIIFYAMTH
jgi:hypothetical protein